MDRGNLGEDGDRRVEGKREMTGSRRILIADDEEGTRRSLALILGRKAYEIEMAGTGREALEKARAGLCELMILDVMLPDMSGVDVCQRLRSEPETMNLPIIMLSGRSQVSDRIRGLEAGADEYVAKPVDPDEIVVRVASLLARTRRLQQVKVATGGKVFGFLGAKGGVGTTTVALNVASFLASLRKKVIALELRSCPGTFALQLRYNASENLSKLLELDPERIDERELAKRLIRFPSGLSVLFGPQNASGLKRMEPEQAEAVVRVAAGAADVAIIDLPCYPLDLCPGVIRACDSLALVADAEPASVYSGRLTLELLESWGVARSVVRTIVVNRTRLPMPMSSAEITSGLGCGLLGTVLYAAEACLAAQAQGEPLVLFQPDSMVAASLRQIAGGLTGDRALASAF